MHIAEIDRWCDVFEQRLKEGVALSVEQFLQEQDLPEAEELVAELRRLECEYRSEVPGGPVATTLLVAGDGDSLAAAADRGRADGHRDSGSADL